MKDTYAQELTERLQEKSKQAFYKALSLKDDDDNDNDPGMIILNELKDYYAHFKGQFDLNWEQGNQLQDATQYYQEAKKSLPINYKPGPRFGRTKTTITLALTLAFEAKLDDIAQVASNMDEEKKRVNQAIR
jgi:hypothetical protein